MKKTKIFLVKSTDLFSYIFETSLLIDENEETVGLTVISLHYLTTNNDDYINEINSRIGKT
jgi:hypothetical protein